MAAKLKLVIECQELDSLIRLTKSSEDLEIRCAAIRRMPFFKESEPRKFWKQMCGLAGDEDAKIRYQILTTFGDETPIGFEEKVMETLEDLMCDNDFSIRNKAKQIAVKFLYSNEHDEHQ